ncbi:MAG: SPFH domain-containing protein [Candidatus Omnitrophica bacterium]|nr:SPFH domain-containing protein [Candidatus Omnitrophota bacterium]
MNEKEEFFRMMQKMRLDKLAGLFKIFLRLLIIVVIIGVFFGNFIFYVGPNEFAIKQINIGLNPGIKETIYNTGFHVIAPFGMQRMHKFPKDTLVFELNDYLERQAKSMQFNVGRWDSYQSADSFSRGKKLKNVNVKKAAHIQTSDGFYVDVDVSVIYHIVDPYKLITTIGPGALYEDNGIIPKVEPKLKETLGELTTEAFFDSRLRVVKAEDAKRLLNEELSAKGIKVDYVLIRYFKYSDEIQKNIELKKLKDQLVFTNQSNAKAAAEEAKVKKVMEEGEANIKVKLEQGNAYVVEKNADRDLYVRTKHAEGDLLIKLAEAKKKELINNAYQQKGSDKLVGLKMAEVFRGLNMIILPSSGASGFNPLDLNKALELFGVQNNKGGM